MSLNSHEYDLLRYCRLSVGKLIEDITGNLLGKHLTLSNRLGFPFGEFVPISPTFL